MIRFALIVASTLGFFLTAALGNFMVPLLRAFGPGQEPEAPQTSQLQPDSDPDDLPPPATPTMGGLCLMVGTLAAVGVGWTAACVAEAAAAVQVLLAANHCLATGLVLPGLGYCELGVLAPIVWGLLLVGLAESARVADGADGVVCGSAFLGMLGLMGAMTILGWFPLGVLPAALAGALMALLLWNFPPAKLLPGSVGSLFLAGALGCVPLSIGWPGLSVPLGLPYWLEGGMVALQILVYQASKGRKQLFGTAPLHRWLEKRGRAPISIFYTFCVFAMLGVALAMQMAKIS